MHTTTVAPASAPLKWEIVPAFALLPKELVWSGKTPPPSLHQRVIVTMNGFGPGVVEGFFHADGYTGIAVRPDTLPEWFVKQKTGLSVVHVFGSEFRPE